MRHLDTNIVVALLRGNQHIASRLEAALPDLGVSTLVVAELLYGAQASARSADGLIAVRHLLATVQVIDFDAAAAEVYGRVRLELRRKGSPTGEIDLLIASVALAHGATLVTNNLRDFEHIDDLVLERLARLIVDPCDVVAVFKAG